MRPILPPPYTSVICWRAIRVPTSRAASKYSGATASLDELKTQMFLNMPQASAPLAALNRRAAQPDHRGDLNRCDQIHQGVHQQARINRVGPQPRITQQQAGSKYGRHTVQVVLLVDHRPNQRGKNDRAGAAQPRMQNSFEQKAAKKRFL